MSLTKRMVLQEKYTSLLEFYKSEIKTNFIFPSELNEDNLYLMKTLFQKSYPDKYEPTVRAILASQQYSVSEDDFSRVYEKTKEFLNWIFKNILTV